MVQGYLQVMILNRLNSEDLSGYALIKDLEKSVGTKPSPGSIYPLLNSMLSDGLIEVREEGRSKIYSITDTGRERFTQIMKEKELMMMKHIEFLRICSTDDCNNLGEVNDLIEKLSERSDVLFRNIDVWANLRYAAFKLLLSEDVEAKETDAREILKGAIEQLNALSEKKPSSEDRGSD